ncbi:MFS transporter (plasmid) [Photobacterium sp. GJ3]|uniref:MFS transporter n=1 Tax=Photobacterium sp. GJ3 TaxID=2829502 RepID=UPI001B8C15DE|nr:MFS transporter [Photobacterium sp. GJ3]QUJ70163.1 MFS transporter [Photobacterium sp. GJ3]
MNSNRISEHTARSNGTMLTYLIHFLMALDLLIIVPLSIFILQETHNDASQAGYLSGSYALCAALSSLLLTRSAQSERKWHLICLLGLAISTLLLPFLQHFNALLVARAAAGCFGGMLAVTNMNALARVSPPQLRKRHMAMLMSTFPLALTLGVPVLLWLTHFFGWQSTFYVIGGLLFMCLLLVLIRPDATHPQDELDSHPADAQKMPPFAVLPFALLIAMTILGTFLVSTQFPVMLVERLHLSETSLALSYLAGGTGSFLLIQSYSRYHGTCSDLTCIAVLSGLMGLCSVLGFFTDNPHLALAMFAGFMTVSSARSLILVTSTLSDLPAALRTKMAGIQNAVQHLSVGLGAIFSSFMISEAATQPIDFKQLVAVSVILTLLVPACIWKHLRSSKQQTRPNQCR